MPLDPYLGEDTFENHPLFKSEEQARIEETLDGEPAPDQLSSERLPWPGEETAENVEGAALDESALDGPPARLRLGRLSPLTPEERLRRYAELAVRVGANVQEGQDVIVTGLVEHVEIARAIAREAYRAGPSTSSSRTAISTCAVRRSSSGRRRSWAGPRRTPLALYRRAIDEKAAFISLTGNPDPDLLADLDPALVGRAEPKELRELSLEHHRRSAHQLDGRLGAERGLGDAGLRRAGHRAAVGGRGGRDAARRARSGRRLARARRQAGGAGGGARRAAGSTRSASAGLGPTSPSGSSRRRTGCARRTRPRTASSTSRTCRPRRSSRARTGAGPTGVVRSTARSSPPGPRVDDLEVRFESGKIVDVQASAGGDIVRAAARDRRAGALPRRAGARRRRRPPSRRPAWSSTTRSSTRTRPVTSPSAADSRGRSATRARGCRRRSSSSAASTSRRCTPTS